MTQVKYLVQVREQSKDSANPGYESHYYHHGSGRGGNITSRQLDVDISISDISDVLLLVLQLHCNFLHVRVHLSHFKNLPQFLVLNL